MAVTRFTVETNWPLTRFGVDGSGYNSYENVVDTSNVAGLVEAWTAPTPDDIYAAPIVANRRVYVGSTDGVVRAFDTSTGGLLWTAPIGNFIVNTAAYANGLLYVMVNGESTLFALNAKTGTVAWTAPVSGAFGAWGATVARGRVFVGADKLYAFDAKAGTQLWTAATGNVAPSAPAVVNGVVYVGGDKTYAFRASDGGLIWSAPATGHTASPAVVNGIVYTGSITNKTLYALNASTGTTDWMLPLGGSPSSPAIANDVVFVAATDSKIYAVHASTGILDWTFSTAGPPFVDPAVANGIVYESVFGNLYAVDASSGGLLWSSSLPWGFAPAVVSDGQIYADSNGTDLVAFHLPS